MEEPPVSETVSPEPPRDRPIWVVANIIDRPEGTTIEPLGDQPAPPWDDDLDSFGMSATATSVETYRGYARWDGNARDWHDVSGMSIRQFYGSEFRVLSWMELGERARNCPDHETCTNANIYHWDDEQRRENNRAGYFASFNVTHDPTRVEITHRFEGPFSTRAEAAAALTRLMAEPIWPKES